MGADRLERMLHDWLEGSAPASAPISLYDDVQRLRDAGRPAPVWQLLAAALLLLVVVAGGLVVAAGGLPGRSQASIAPAGSACAVGAPSGTALVLLDSTAASGGRTGVPGKSGEASDSPWPNIGVGVEDAVSVASGSSLTLRWGDGASCLAAWRASALPYSLASAGPVGVPLTLANSAGSGAKTGLFPAPPDGDWIVRIDVSVSGSATSPWYFRVRVDLPGPSPVGSPVSPAVPCGPADLAHAPTFVLRTSDGASHVATPYGATWAGEPFGDGTWLPSQTVATPSGRGLQVDVSGDTCAVEWTILYGPPPATGPGAGGFLPAGDLVPAVVNRDPAFASQNRFALADLPSGTWLIAGEFGFVHGEVLVVWEVSVP